MRYARVGIKILDFNATHAATRASPTVPLTFILAACSAAARPSPITPPGDDVMDEMLVGLTRATADEGGRVRRTPTSSRCAYASRCSGAS